MDVKQRYRVGDRVWHARRGPGVVTERGRMENGEPISTVAFDDGVTMLVHPDHLTPEPAPESVHDPGPVTANVPCEWTPDGHHWGHHGDDGVQACIHCGVTRFHASEVRQPDPAPASEFDRLLAIHTTYVEQVHEPLLAMLDREEIREVYQRRAWTRDFLDDVLMHLDDLVERARKARAAREERGDGE